MSDKMFNAFLNKPKDKPVTIMDLANQYGSIKDIPDEELDQCGFMRDGENRVVRKDVKEYEEVKKAEEAKEWEKKMEKKTADKPFDKIKVELETKRMQSRVISEELEWEMSSYYDGLMADLEEREGFFNIVPKDSTLWIFKKQFSNWLDGKEIDQEIKREIYFELYNLIDHLNTHNNLDSLAYDLDKYFRSKNVEQRNAENLFNILEKEKGTLADTERHKAEYDEDAVSELESDDESLLKFCADNHITSYQKLVLFLVKDFIKDKGFPKVADYVKDVTTFDDLREKLRTIKSELLPSFKEEREYKEKISQAPIEEKKNLSKGLKEASLKREAEKRLLLGIAEFISPYEITSQFFKKTIEKLQTYLVAGSGNAEEAVFYLDGNPDFDKDNDPGAVSGDCTKGRPLPFNDPEVPAYNIKVYNNCDKYIGNIYLLATSTLDGERCWHLDAIQIPSTVDWAKSAKIITEEIGKAAEKQGIKYISINIIEEHISNYDYIQSAFSELIKKDEEKNPEIIDIVMINSKDPKYMKFQGDGADYVIWQNNKLN